MSREQRAETFNEGLMKACGTTLVTVDRLAALEAVAEAARQNREARRHWNSTLQGTAAVTSAAVSLKDTQAAVDAALDALSNRGTVMSPEQRCATCRHWYGSPGGSFTMRLGHGTCRRIADDDDPWSPDPSEAAWIAGNEGERHPVLRTLADFGCTEWATEETP